MDFLQAERIADDGCVHKAVPLFVPTFAVFDAALNAVAFAFGPGNSTFIAPPLHSLVAHPREAYAALAVAEYVEDFEVIGYAGEHLNGLTIADVYASIVRLQFFIDLQQAVILKLQVAQAYIGVFDDGRLKAKHDEVGHPGLFGQHERLVILRAQVALHPDEVDGVLRLRHGAAKKGGMEVKQGRARTGDWGLRTG